MNKNRKKGFTLVELLVVIAILAILAVVSVVGYTSFTKKAKEADDISLTTQMNTILDADSAGGSSYETPNDAVTALEEGGLIVTKLTPTSNNYIYVYNTSGKQGERMLLLDESYNVKFPTGATLSGSRSNYFTFVSDSKEALKYSKDGFSIYLKDSYSDTSVSVSTGVDVGDVTKVTEINYTNSSTKDSVIIRTTNGTLKINAPEGTVKHYGTCENVVIESVANESYHENGSVTVSMEVKAGHVVIEPKASVKEVSVPESAAETTSVVLKENSNVQTIVLDSAKASVEVKENATVKDVVASADAAKNITNNSSTTITSVTKTTVSTYDDLKNALSKGDKYIVFSDNITGQDDKTTQTINSTTKDVYKYGITISHDVILDGNGKKFITEGVRGIVIDQGESNSVNVTIKNLQLEVNHDPSKFTGTYKEYDNYTRGIQVNQKNTTLTIDNVEILTNTTNNNEGVHYGINVTDDSSVDLTVNNSKIRGYAALNLWYANYKVKVTNSVLEGINSYDGNSDGFAAIVCEGNFTDTYSHSIDVEIINSEIIVRATGKAYEVPVSFHGYYCTVSLTNTKITTYGEEASSDVLAPYYNDEKYHNKLIIDNKETETVNLSLISKEDEEQYYKENPSESSSSESGTQSSSQS